MKLLKRVLLATDFTKAAADAQAAAIHIARTFGSEVVPFHVVNAAPDVSFAAAWLDIKNEVDERLKSVVAQLQEAGVESGHPVLEVGPPYACIIDQANMCDVNAIVLGSGEQTDEIGSTAEQVARRSNKPVWIVKSGAAGAVERILCPFDFSLHSQRALVNAIHLARQLDARLVLLHVIESPSPPSSTTAASSDRQAYIDEQRQRLAGVLARLDSHGVNVDCEVRTGEPPSQIQNAARELKADLLVMGSAGRTGLSRLFLGSVATKVLRHLPCSVITVKAEQAIRLEFDAETEADSTALFERGKQLLAGGFAYEAAAELRAYLAKHSLSHEACELLATASARLGRIEEAQKYRDEAARICRTLERRQIEADVRRKHPLWQS